MKKVLSKRIFRDFKANIGRYLALSVVIALCMYLVISIVGAANMIIKGTKEHQIRNHVEDGQFETFVELTNEQISELESFNITLERQFSIDVRLNNGDTLRIFKNRENINLIELVDGSLASDDSQIVIERRYSECNGISIGSTITISDTTYIVSGIATTPDYDNPKEEISSTATDSDSFGTAFVTPSAYEELLNSDIVTKAEIYRYAFVINGDFSAEDLKDWLTAHKIEADEVTDEAFLEYWERSGGRIDDLQEGIDELLEGSDELMDGITELCDNNDDLNEAASALVDNYFDSASSSLSSYGINVELTEYNYYDTLTALSENTPNTAMGESLTELRDNLESILVFRDGITEYTNGTSECADGTEELRDGISTLDEETDEFINDKLDMSISNLSFFLEASDNIRISAAANDVILNYQVGLVAGVIIMVLFTYVISVFVVHNINSESSIIGSLYALGATKNDLITHYITLPVIICFISGLVGSLIGFSPVGIRYQTADSYAYYSLPDFKTIYEPYLLFYGIIMPPLVAAVVNNLIIRRKLSSTALSLIRNEQKQGKIHKISLNGLGFIKKFQIRQMINELRSGLAIVLGLFISLLIVMMSLDCYTLCSNVAKDTKNDTHYEHLYMYKFAQEELPEEGYIAYGSSLKTQRVFGYTFDAFVYGITDDNPYFAVELPAAPDEVVISEMMHTKLNLNIGDTLVLCDNEENKLYAFNVAGIADYSAQLCCFMSIDNAREIFGAEEDEYNIVFSDNALEIPSNELVLNLDKAGITKGVEVFVDLMSGLIFILAFASIVILILVMYLMMKVMIDRSSYSISLMKVFGFKGKDIKKLYINGNFYLVVIGTLILLPLAKLIMDALYPYFISNGAININLNVNPLYMLGIFLMVIILYFIISTVLLIRISKIVPAEALKNRE